MLKKFNILIGATGYKFPLLRPALTESKISDETPFVGEGLTVASGASGLP